MLIQLAIVLFLGVAFMGSNAMDAPCTCLRDYNCALIPPSNVTWPCYQGPIENAIKCFETDPLLKVGTTWACGNCSKYGFPNYSGKNDPIYTTMELWNK